MKYVVFDSAFKDTRKIAGSQVENSKSFLEIGFCLESVVCYSVAG